MSKSFKLKNNNYIDSSSVSYNKQSLSNLLDNYMSGITIEDTVANSYVRLFTFQLDVPWKMSSVLFYLCDTQSGNISNIVNLCLKKPAGEASVFISAFKTMNLGVIDITQQLVACITSLNKVEVYFKMGLSQSPTINIISLSRLENSDAFGKLTLDMNTVVSALPNGDTIYVANMF